MKQHFHIVPDVAIKPLGLSVAVSSIITSERSGFVPQALVATPDGWRKASALEPNDEVLTFDDGFQPVVSVSSRCAVEPVSSRSRSLSHVSIPEGLLGNRGVVNLLPDQYVMVESDAGEDLFEDPFVLIRAEALAMIEGVEKVNAKVPPDSVVLEFESEQLVVEASGVPHYCFGGDDHLHQDATGYRVLQDDEAEVIAMCIDAEAAGRLVWRIDPEAILARTVVRI